MSWAFFQITTAGGAGYRRDRPLPGSVVGCNLTSGFDFSSSFLPTRWVSGGGGGEGGRRRSLLLGTAWSQRYYATAWKRNRFRKSCFLSEHFHFVHGLCLLWPVSSLLVGSWVRRGVFLSVNAVIFFYFEWCPDGQRWQCVACLGTGKTYIWGITRVCTGSNQRL